MQITDLTPKKRDALLEALASPTHSLVRHGKFYIAHNVRQGAGGARVTAFSGRLMRMLDRDYLADFDEPLAPTRVTLNKQGLALAQQLRDAQQRKAGAA